MDLNFNLLILFVILIFIDFYSEMQLKNSGSIFERVFHLLNLKSLFNIIKFIFLVCFVSILVNKSYGQNLKDLFDLPFIDFIINGSIVTFIIGVVVIFYNSKSIIKQFGNYYLSQEFPKLNSLFSNLLYLAYRFISLLLIYVIFKFIFTYLYSLDLNLRESELSLFDWFRYKHDGEDNYNKGVYLSLVLTAFVFFIFNNAFLKRESDYFQIRKIRWSFFKYFFISVILSIGLFFGFFSVLNGIYNLINTGFSDWLTKENVLGILPIRISSILILYYLITYVYNEVLHKNLSSFLMIGLLPIRKDVDLKYRNFISFQKRETLFFCQISFYVVNLALAEMFIIYGYKSIYLSILNFSILFILDDFKIIDDYVGRFRSILPKHFLRITLFNLIMIVVSVVVLITYDFHFFLYLYIFITIVLAYYYIRNLNHYF